ncbi:MAG: choice-of-anchor R domain-containing protein [Rubrivivax sp.]
MPPFTAFLKHFMPLVMGPRLPAWEPWRRSLVSVALAALIAAAPCAARAAVVLSNVPIATNGGSPVTVTAWKALILTTGTAASTLDQVVLGLNPEIEPNVPSQRKVEIALYGAAAGVPTVQQGSTGLLNVDIQQLRGTYTFPIPGGFSLSANTQYALVIRSDATGIKWGNTSTSQPTGSGGFSYIGFSTSSDSEATWTSEAVNTKNVLQVNVTVAPPAQVPMASTWGVALLGLLMAGAGAGLLRRRPAAA